MKNPYKSNEQEEWCTNQKQVNSVILSYIRCSQLLRFFLLCIVVLCMAMPEQSTYDESDCICGVNVNMAKGIEIYVIFNSRIEYFEYELLIECRIRN